ncbi:MAG: hypothetical protein ACSHX5_05045 [Phycisphaerales bacterium]
MNQSDQPKPGKESQDRSRHGVGPHNQGSGPSDEQSKSGDSAEMVCVTLQRPPHFWRFACAAGDSRDLLEMLADLADAEDSPLTWDDAELIASQIVLHHGDDRTQAGPKHAR